MPTDGAWTHSIHRRTRELLLRVRVLFSTPGVLLAGNSGGAIAAMASLTAAAESLTFLVNPWALSIGAWVGLYFAMRIAVMVGVEGTASLLCRLLPKLPSRTGPAQPYQHPVDWTDVIYLFINSFIEFCFAAHLSFFSWNSPMIARSLESVGLLNTVGGVWMLLVCDDMLYAPVHRLMHWPPLYKYVHKHHHRNTYPSRGYVDGANEHPLEQVVAMSLHGSAARIVAATTGLHVAAITAHLGLKAMGAVFNHTGTDLQIRFLGIDYSSGAHEMHHRKPNKNYAQYVLFWDRLMGTHAPYELPGKRTAD